MYESDCLQKTGINFCLIDIEAGDDERVLVWLCATQDADAALKSNPFILKGLLRD